MAAYHVCLQGKRGTADALAFEYDGVSGCVALCREINDQSYRPSRAIVFISPRPVMREIFGAAFRDRVADTLLALKFRPLIEARFIDDNYSTREGRGTLYGIRRVSEMIRWRSAGYTHDCYVLKLDILSFFMSIPKELAYRKFSDFVRRNYRGSDIEVVLWLLKVILYDRPEQHCVRKSPLSAWQALPPSKSLFNSDGRHGFSVGREIIQMTALVFLDDFDQEMQAFTDVVSYGHYMDDMVFVSNDLAVLQGCRDMARQWTLRNGITLHPRKMYLQHCGKGILFAGGMIRPGRIYLSKRTVGNWFSALERFNLLAQDHADYAQQNVAHFASVMNSYFGLARHFAAWNISHRVIRLISPEWYKVMYVSGRGGKYKVVIRRPYRPRNVAQARLREEMRAMFTKE